jgi:hypothetical protein
MGNRIASKTPRSGAKAIFQTMLMSDLHLEFGNVILPEFPVVAPILILAGDIGRLDVPSLQTFLLAQCQRFEHMFYVAGNHCFYEGEYENRLQQLREVDNLDSRINWVNVYVKKCTNQLIETNSTGLSGRGSVAIGDFNNETHVRKY